MGEEGTQVPRLNSCRPNLWGQKFKREMAWGPSQEVWQLSALSCRRKPLEVPVPGCVQPTLCPEVASQRWAVSHSCSQGTGGFS